MVAVAGLVSWSEPQYLPPLLALTRKQANAIALRTLRPQAGKQNVVVFGLPRALKKGTTVAPADPPKGKPGKTAHRSQYLLVDDSRGKLVKRTSIRWYPTVNGRRPAFPATPKAYRAKTFRVFSRVGYAKAAAARTGAVHPAHVAARQHPAGCAQGRVHPHRDRLRGPPEPQRLRRGLGCTRQTI